MIITGLLLGTLLGAVLQRGRFCVTGFLRDIYLRRTFRPFTALLIVISVQALGVQILTTAGIIHPEYDPFAPLAVIVGSTLFGIGIVLAGGCASGTWYRAGEGLVGSWIALIAYAVSAAAMKTGALTGLNDWGRSITTSHVSIAEDFHINPWALALALSAGTAYLAWNYHKTRPARPRPIPAGDTSLRARIFSTPLPLYTTAIIVGLIGVAAWPLSAATGRNDGLGITTPSKNVINYIVTGEASYLDWGALLVLGILLGSLIAASLSGEFRIRVPDSRTTLASLAGGILMGIGASWAGGCTVGNGMVQTSLFSYQGWIALAFTALGVFAAAKFYLIPTTRGGAQNTRSGSTSSTRTGAYTTAEPTPTITSTDTTTIGGSNFGGHGGTALATRPALTFATADAGLRITQPTRTLTAIGENHYQLDTRGDVCPFPLMKLKNAASELSHGDSITITFDCTQATDAIPSWAAEQGHTVTDFAQLGPADWEITLALTGNNP